MKNIFRAIYKSIKQIGLVSFVLSIAFLSMVAVSFVWGAPSQSPPNGNVLPPINSSDTGQYKFGSLGIGGLFVSYVKAMFNGEICLNGTCITSWDQGLGLQEPITIELNDPTNTNWTCSDINLQDYCGDEDGCKIIYYGLHNGNDQVRVLPSYIFMEQPGWSPNLRSGVYGFNRQDGGDIGFNTGAGETYNIIQPWSWAWMQNYNFNGCGGDNAAFADPYKFRFTTHPQIRSKFVIFDNPF